MSHRFFKTPIDFRNWLAENGHKKSELIVGFHKQASGKPSITYPEAVDEALCFGWIDGVRRKVDQTSYCVRFTPRKPKSVWSLINRRRAAELKKMGRMQPAGLKAFSLRNEQETGIYSFENRPRKFERAFEEKFRAHKRAWKFFEDSPPSFKRTAIFWVMSAKKEETRVRRLDRLIDASDKGMRLDELLGRAKTKGL